MRTSRCLRTTDRTGVLNFGSHLIALFDQENLVCALVFEGRIDFASILVIFCKRLCRESWMGSPSLVLPISFLLIPK